jgi:hypothetical protein
MIVVKYVRECMHTYERLFHTNKQKERNPSIDSHCHCSNVVHNDDDDQSILAY